MLTVAHAKNRGLLVDPNAALLRVHPAATWHRENPNVPPAHPGAGPCT